MRVFVFKNLIRKVILIRPKRKETKNPIIKGKREAPISPVFKILMEVKTPAPPIAGIPSKKENLAASLLLMP